VKTNIYQFVGGFDKVVGNWFFGSALSYAHTEDLQGSSRTNSETVGATPYVAYKINDFLFASALAGYMYTHMNQTNGASDIDVHDYFTEGNINAFKVIQSFVLKARLGVRYKHTNSSLDNGFAGRDNTFDELTWIGDGEVGYLFNNKLRIYTGFRYEYIDREASAASSLVHDSLAFMRYGLEYPVSDQLLIGARFQHDVNEEDLDYMTGSVNMRLMF
jgi:hypothetical protein